MKSMYKYILTAVLFMALYPSAQSQNTSENGIGVDDVLVLPPLFEYPVAPDNLEWVERSNWLVEHFWDNFNFKQKSVGQNQLVHAFRTYVVPLHMADRESAIKSVKNLVKKLQKQPTLMLQFTQAAERTVYQPETAELIIDEVYVEFLKGLMSTKKIPDLRKARYKAQLQSLQNCMVGGKLPSFRFTDRNGVNQTYSQTGVPTIIEFGDFDCSDCRIVRLRLETDDELQSIVNEGKARIVFISPDVDEDTVTEWNHGVSKYPETWTVGRAMDLEEVLDLRIVPCLYIIDASGNIVSKNATTDAAIKYVKENMIQ